MWVQDDRITDLVKRQVGRKGKGSEGSIRAARFRDGEKDAVASRFPLYWAFYLQELLMGMNKGGADVVTETSARNV